MEHGADGNVPQTGRRTLIANDAIGQHGEGVRRVAEVGALTLDTKTAAAVGVVDKGQFTAEAMRLSERGEFSCLRTERFFLGARIGNEKANTEVQRSDPSG